MNIKTFTRNIISTLQNDIQHGERDKEKRLEAKVVFGELIAELTRIIIDDRDCYKDCACQPEQGIKRLIKDKGHIYKNTCINKTIIT